MRIHGQKILLSQIEDARLENLLVVEDIRSGKQHIVSGENCFVNVLNFVDYYWPSDLNRYPATVVLYNDKTDSLEGLYALVERSQRLVFERYVTSADRKRRKTAEAVKRRRQKGIQPVDHQPSGAGGEADLVAAIRQSGDRKRPEGPEVISREELRAMRDESQANLVAAIRQMGDRKRQEGPETIHPKELQASRDQGLADLVAATRKT